MKNFFAALALALTFSACTKNAQHADKISFRLPTEPPSLDWTLATDNVSREVINNLQEGLVQHNAESNVEKALAESWEISKDGKTYTFKLREGLKWSDGQPLVAQHFADSWERLLTPATASEYAYFLFDIAGAEDFFNKKITDFSKVGVKATDDRTLVVTLRNAAAYFLHIPTFWVTYPIRKDVIAKHAGKWTEAGNLVSAGPYTLKVWEHDSKIVLEKNANYYEAAAVEIPTVEFRIVHENATAVSLFDSKAIDIVRDLPPLQIRSLAGSPSFVRSPLLRGYYVGFNVKNAAVSDPKIRQAIGLAIDRKEIEQILGPMASATTSWIPPGLLGANTERGIAFNADQAKALWAQIKNKPAKLEYWFDQTEKNKLVAENVQAQLKRNLGLEIVLQNQEWKVYLKKLDNDAPDMFRMGWGADFPDPDNFMNLFTCNSGNNHTRLCNKEYDGLISKAAATLAPEARKDLYERAQKILLEQETAIVPLFTETNLHLVSPRVEGFKLNSMGDFAFRDLKLKK